MKKCVICDSSRVRKIIGWSEYTIHKCNDCKLIFASPLPSDDILSDYYQGFMFNKPTQSEISKQIEKRKKELKKLFSLESEPQSKNFLDFGGGTGSAYKAACELNMKVYYQDLDEEAKSFVKEQYGLIDDFIIDNITDSEVTFDYIFSDNVIEHLKNPIEYITEMKRVLNNNGEIVIKTPHGMNTESFFIPLVTVRVYFFKSLKNNSLLNAIKSYFLRFWHCDPPRHLFSFSKPNLKITALKAGFDESEIEISHYNIPFLRYSLTELFFNFRRSRNLKSKILRLIILPIIPFEVLSRVLQTILLSLKILTPGGIILKLKKSSRQRKTSPLNLSQNRT